MTTYVNPTVTGFPTATYINGDYYGQLIRDPDSDYRGWTAFGSTAQQSLLATKTHNGDVYWIALPQYHMLLSEMKLLIDAQEAEWESINYSNVTITITGQGTTDPPAGSYPQTYEQGNDLSIGVVPANGWYLQHIIRNGTPISGTAITNLGAVENLEVVLLESPPVEPGKSSVTIVVTGNGDTIPTPGTHTDYDIGSILYVSPTPATGWRYLKMIRNGIDWTTANPGEFLNLAATEVIEVVFEEILIEKGEIVFERRVAQRLYEFAVKYDRQRLIEILKKTFRWKQV